MEDFIIDNGGKIYTIFHANNEPVVEKLPNFHEQMRRKEKKMREQDWKRMARFNYKKK